MKIIIKNGLPRLVFLGTEINNGVKIYREFTIPRRPIINFLEDLILILRSKFERYNINNTFEAGVFLSHLRVTRPEDRILAVGLGSGSTLIPMVKFMESSMGFYRCIEASSSQIEIAKKNIELNNIDPSKFEILNAFAGNEVYGAYGESSEKNIDINNYDFDVLEMDCEGSELSNLSSLIKRPRNIIVELHPSHFDENYKDFDNFLTLMEEKGYRYQFAYGHNGDYLNINYARKYYNSTNANGENDSCIEERNKVFFGTCPIVVTFINKSFIVENN